MARKKPYTLAACLFLPQKSRLWVLRAVTVREAWVSRTPMELVGPQSIWEEAEEGKGGPCAGSGESNPQV